MTSLTYAYKMEHLENICHRAEEPEKLLKELENTIARYKNDAILKAVDDGEITLKAAMTPGWFDGGAVGMREVVG